MDADGMRKFTVTAILPADASDDYKTVTFTTGSGKFDVNGKESADRQIDTEGKTQLLVIVGDVAGKFSITASIGSKDPKYSVSKQFRLLPVSSANIIAVMLTDTTSIRADGVSLINVNVDLNHTAVSVVDVSSSEGVFVGSNKATDESNVDQEGKTTFQLRVGKNPTQYVIVTSITNGIKVIKKVSVARAYAESMITEAESLKVTSDAPVNISVFLKRAKGAVSIGTDVLFEPYQQDVDGTQKSVGRITGTSAGTGEDGKIQATFHADSENIDSSRPIRVRISTTKDDGSTLSQVIELTFKEG